MGEHDRIEFRPYRLEFPVSVDNEIIVSCKQEGCSWFDGQDLATFHPAVAHHRVASRPQRSAQGSGDLRLGDSC